MLGERVQVVSGRKVAVGTVGRCVWVGNTRYGPCVRLLLEDGAGSATVVLSARSVRVLKGQPVQQSLFGAPVDDLGDIPF